MGGGGGGGGGVIGEVAEKVKNEFKKGTDKVAETTRQVVLKPLEQGLKDPLKPIKNPSEARYDALMPIANAGDIIAKDIQEGIGQTGIKQVGNELARGSENIGREWTIGVGNINREITNAGDTGQKIWDNLTGETARKGAEEAKRKAEEERIANEARMNEENLKGKKSKEYGRIRARQLSLMGAYRGRAGTMITNPNLSAGSSNFMGLGSGTGKTLLGS